MNSNSTRQFNRLTFIDDGRFVKKTSSYVSKFIDEINWLVTLPKQLKKYIPTIKDYKIDGKNSYIVYHFIKWDTLHCKFIQSKPLYRWTKIAEMYSKLLKDFKKIKPNKFDKEYWTKQFINMYLIKTINRLKDLNNDNKFRLFFNTKNILINGIEYPSITSIIKWLENILITYIETGEWKSKYFHNICTSVANNVCFFHGDLCFSNVFVNCKEKKIICIDPRASFGEDKKYGDLLFDFAKIYESASGLYDFVIEDKFSVKINSKSFNYKINISKNAMSCQKAFEKIWPKKYLLEIKLIEALQFLCMIPFHADHYKRQLVFLAHGIVRFYNIIKQEWK